MNFRALKALWKANVPPMVWLSTPLVVGAIILGLDGRPPNWAAIGLFLAASTILMGILEFANVYTDREEDRLYFPGNPVLTGEVDAGTARRALIAENVLAGVLLIALVAVTREWAAAVTLLASWAVNLAYSLPPLRLKETVAVPFIYGLLYVLPTLAAWLLVEPSLLASDGLILGYCLVLFLFSFGNGITVKLRKTYHAFHSGLIEVAQGGSVYDLKTVGLGLKVRHAVALEAIAMLGAFLPVPVFWRMGMFDSPMSIALLAAALPTAAFAVFTRLRDPVGSGPRCVVYVTMASVDIALVLFGVALSSLVHWGFAVLACLAYLALFVPLFAAIHPVGPRTVAAPWAEMEKWSGQ